MIGTWLGEDFSEREEMEEGECSVEREGECFGERRTGAEKAKEREMEL